MNHDDVPKTEEEMRAKGLVAMNAAQLIERLSGKCFVGLYRAPFSYVMCMGEDGTQWGQNNYGTRDEGCWKIHAEANTMTTSWSGGWDDHTTHGYADGDAIHLFDVETGVWRTTMIREISAEELASSQSGGK